MREDIAANQKDKQADAPDRTAELSGLDTDENTPDWEALEIGDTGTLTWYRRGKVTGRPLRTCSATVSGKRLRQPARQRQRLVAQLGDHQHDYDRHGGLGQLDDRPGPGRAPDDQTTDHQHLIS